MTIKKNIFIQHACMYTRAGIELVLDDMYINDINVEITASVASLDVTAYKLLCENSADIFILGLQKNSDNYGCLLGFIIEWLPLCYPCAKAIIMAYTQSIGLLRDCLSGLGNMIQVLDNSVKVKELQLYLCDAIIGMQHIKYKQKTVAPLTHQEIKVLGYLLKGVPVLSIAKSLKINHKTVSSHKRSAMNKMGVTSLHSLIKCDINATMMTKSFYI